MMEFTSQNDNILAHLKSGRAITGLEALKNFGCIHLPRRIKDLREKGHAIKDQWVKLPNGKRCKEYWLPR